MDKNKTYLYTTYKKLTSENDTHRLEVKAWETKRVQTNRNEKKAGIVVCLLDRKKQTITQRPY